MTITEQVNHYKNLSTKTKKLAQFLDNENKELKTEKQRLLNKISFQKKSLKKCAVDDETTFKVCFKFTIENNMFYYVKKGEDYVSQAILSS